MREYLCSKNGKFVIATAHFLERKSQRLRGMSEARFTSLLSMVLTKYHQDKEKFDSLPNNTELFCYSNQLRRGVVLSHRFDTKYDTGSKHFVLLTVYPLGASRPAHPETKKVILN